jgi:hypothetical protein
MMRFFPQSDNELPVLVWTGTDEDHADCAWCMTEQGQDLGNGSHGICAPHAWQLREQQAKRKAERAKRH